MPNQSAHLDRLFQSLADPTRRAVLERLSAGPAAMSELAKPFRMALPSFSQHLSMLEQSGLVQSTKAGRVRTYRIVPRSFAVAETWLDKRRRTWEGRLDRLDNYLLEMKENETPHD